MTRRREFPTFVKRAARERSNGICECHIVPQLPTYRIGCGCKLSSGNIFYEHVQPDGAGGSPSLANCACLVKTCWLLKTNGFDKPIVAKTRRQSDRARNIKRAPSRQLPGARRSPIKITLANGPVDRRTGEPWRGWR